MGDLPRSRRPRLCKKSKMFKNTKRYSTVFCWLATSDRPTVKVSKSIPLLKSFHTSCCLDELRKCKCMGIAVECYFKTTSMKFLNGGIKKCKLSTQVSISVSCMDHTSCLLVGIIHVETLL